MIHFHSIYYRRRREDNTLKDQSVVYYKESQWSSLHQIMIKRNELMRDMKIVEEYKQREEAWENAYMMNRIAFVRKIEELDEVRFVVLQRNELHKMMEN